MSNSSTSSCTGCLSSLFLLSLIGALLFGLVKCSVSIGNFSLGSSTSIGQSGKSDDSANLEQKKPLIQASVEQFHTQLKQGKCTDIYQQANDVFKQFSSQSNFVENCQRMRRELGTVKSSQPVGWWKPLDLPDDQTIYLLVQYQTNFSQASAVETFIWSVKDGKATLYSYQVNPLNLEKPKSGTTI